MSQAFVREPEAELADMDVPERPQSVHPNYITPAGLERLKEQIAGLRQRTMALEAQKEDLSVRSELGPLLAELRYLEKRVQGAIPIDPATQGGDEIRFGATVEMEDEEGRRHVFTIVGEDEADVEKGLISWVSPLGRELLDKRAGDAIRWRRPVGDLDLEILSFRYGS